MDTFCEDVHEDDFGRVVEDFAFGLVVGACDNVASVDVDCGRIEGGINSVRLITLDHRQLVVKVSSYFSDNYEIVHVLIYPS